MGLDMYMFKVDRLNDEELNVVRGKNLDKVSFDQYVFLQKEGYERYPELYGDLADFAREVGVQREIVNTEDCFKKYGITEDDVYGVHHAPNSLTLHTQKGEIVLNEEELASFTEVKDIEVYVFKCERVAYWRKYYELDSFISDNLEYGVENCGYHLIDSDLKKEVKRFLKMKNPESFQGNLDIKLLEDDSNIFYYAWW